MSGMPKLSEEVVFEIGDDDTVTLVDGSAAVAGGDGGQADDGNQPITDDPLAGIEDLRRQVEKNDNLRRQAEQNAQRESQARQEAERRAAQATEEARQARQIAESSNFDSVVNALAATERELAGLESLKATALEKGEYDSVAKYDTQMAKVGARVVQLESAKASIETARRNAPQQQQQPQPQQQPQMTQEQANQDFLNRLPTRSADWIRAHPQFFADQNFSRRVLAAAEYAEAIEGVNHNTDRYFEIIEEAVGLRTPQSPASAASHVQQRASAAAPPPPPPPPPPAQPQRQAAPAAAPSRSSPEPAGRNNGRTITLSVEEREMAHHLHPRRKPTDPDPEVIYAKNKAALIREGKLGQPG